MRAAPAVTFTVATKPPFHWLSEIVAVHPLPVGGGEVVVGGGVGEVVVGGGVVVPLFKASRAAVYAAFLFPLPSNSSGVPLARHESESRMPHTVIPLQRVTARQARTAAAYELAWAVP